jgi:hypothetical protein
MLHRCNSAVTRTADGRPTYAPGIALELERQLDEWYDYLPGNIRFASIQLLDHVQRFIDAYVQLLPRIAFAVDDCLVYKWTLSVR